MTGAAVIAVIVLFVPVPLLLGDPSNIGTEILTTSEPQLKSDSTPLRPVQAGDQMVISTAVRNNDPEYDWSGYVLVEVRNENGITILLNWQSALFGKGDETEIGVSWTPDYAGNYSLRTFAISDLENPRVMSSVKESHVTVEPSNATVSSLCSGSASCFTGVVTKVVDGDTLDVGNTRIRLSLVDTPEIGEAGYDEATEYTSELCLVGSTVLVDQDDGQPMDDFGRMVAKVTCEGDMIINGELLESGYAEVLTEYCDRSEFSQEEWIYPACDVATSIQ